MKFSVWQTICIFFILISFYGHAQPKSKYLYGYIVTLEGDTLKGKVQPRGNKFILLNTVTRKTKKYKSKEIRAYKYGRNRFENINGFYRIVINGPVRYYIKAVASVYYLDGRYWSNTYYCVKRPEEEEVTILYIQRIARPGLISKTSLTEMIITDLAVHMTHDLIATKKLTLFSNMKKIAKEYFKDCPSLVEDLDKGIYNNKASIRKMVERYNRYVLSN